MEKKMDDPIQWLTTLLEKAKTLTPYYHAMNLSTVDPDTLMPRSRIVFMHRIIDEKLEFYTNYQSHKGQEIAKNPNACANFFWQDLHMQAIVQGRITKAPRSESETYFANRIKAKQVAAIVSNQSQVIDGFDWLKAEYEQMMSQYQHETVSCPPNWGGYHLTPQRIEIWVGSPIRLHERHEFIRDGDYWRQQILAP